MNMIQRNTYDYRISNDIRAFSLVFMLIFFVNFACSAYTICTTLRPVPGHAGRVKRDITSAPDQAACTSFGEVLAMPPPTA